MGFKSQIIQRSEVSKIFFPTLSTLYQIMPNFGGRETLLLQIQKITNMSLQLKTMTKGILALAMIVTLMSCGKDDEGPAYEFIDQPLQGKIGGVDFMMKDGKVEEGFFEEDGWFIEIYGETEVADACDVEIAETNYLFFNIPLEVGLYKLYFKLSTFEGQLVNLYDVEGEDMQNLASSGAIEILSVSETDVTGRMDARFNNQNTVNGNFTVAFCPVEVVVD
jgi:hypothetical protein